MKPLTHTASRYAFVLMSAVASMLTDPAAANLIENPGFETGDFTGWKLAGFGNVGVDSTDPHSGSYAAFFGEGSPIAKQTIDTIPGATYTISFWLSNMATRGDGFGVTWGEQTLLDLLDSDRFQYRLFTFSGVRATDLTETLFFNGTAQEGFWYLDDVSVIQTVSTPEPFSTLWLAIPVTGILTLKRLYRKTA